MDFLRDPLWQFVGAVLAVLAIIVSIVLFFIQRRKKALTYEVISRTSVLSASDEVSGKLQILFQGEPVSKVHLIVLKLANTGNVPIISNDFEREVSFIFNGCDKILSAEISELVPSNLSAQILSKDKSVALKPLLLNPGDSILLKTLISGFDNKIEVDGRVVGVKSIDKRTESNSWSFIAMFAGVIIVSLTLFPNANQSPDQLMVKSPITFAAIIVGYILMFVGLFANKTGRKIFEAYLDIIRKFVR